ncbi:winged helix-turn-helix transcriptional regulator [[Clostridium] colinum]|uniref:winged helix-turn-helix transcriptional regulator n=1 Tax=[Clostridium] colinum TaxID=36835 RepID=UPI0020241463|nr:helix-turn-helix domain-containing protein [[Clostridium] colinum]
MEKIKVVCEIEVTLKMIGGKYKPLILYYLIENKTKRFNEILSFLNSVSQKTLTNQLRELETDGLINRKIYPQVPPKVEYSITEKGKTLLPILDLMCEWSEKNIDNRFEIINPQCNSQG